MIRLYGAYTDGYTPAGTVNIAVRYIDVTHIRGRRAYLPDGTWIDRRRLHGSAAAAIGALLDVHVTQAASLARALANSTAIAYACRKKTERLDSISPTPMPAGFLRSFDKAGRKVAS